MGLTHSKADAGGTAAPPMPNFLAASSPVVKAAIEEIKARGRGATQITLPPRGPDRPP